MAYKPRQASKSNSAVPPVMSPDAAGIDIGATEIFVTVSADRAGGKGPFLPDVHAGSVHVGGILTSRRKTKLRKRSCRRPTRRRT